MEPRYFGIGYIAQFALLKRFPFPNPLFIRFGSEINNFELNYLKLIAILHGIFSHERKKLRRKSSTKFPLDNDDSFKDLAADKKQPWNEFRTITSNNGD